MEKTVWVLGSNHSNAHKSIPWRANPFPNFSNCDVLIINLETFGAEELRRKQDLFDNARKYIFDLLMTGEKEAYIVLSPNQSYLEWLPMYPELRETAPAEVEKPAPVSSINEYMSMVETCPFYIHGFNSEYFREKTDPQSAYHETYRFTHEARNYEDGYLAGVHVDLRIMNKAKQVIGSNARFVISYGYRNENQFLSGELYFLPPPTKCNAEQAINLILTAFTGGTLTESPPAWEERVDLPGLQGIKDNILHNQTEVNNLTKDITALEAEEKRLTNFRRLLWTNGAPLENTVKEAFIFLEFPEIRKIRAPNLEDWVIDLKTSKEYQYGVFEIKGADERTSLADLTQCNKWVDDFIVENIGTAKGIFVPNQHRLKDINKNEKKKEHFEGNELKYAGSREICILPSHEIFYACVEKLKGDPRITREFIEEKITNSFGLCRLREA